MMIFSTLNRQFLKQDEVDKFISGIWTERYYGDSEVELVLPATEEMIRKLPEGTFLSEADSKEVMIIETVDVDDKGNLKVSGISLLSWMNNRFIRASAVPEDRYWNTGSAIPGWVLWAILYWWCIDGVYLNGSTNIGIPNAAQFKIPGLGLKGYDTSDAPAEFAIPYGPVYDAMRAVAVMYQIGMTITLEWANDSGYSLQFLAYKGLDRTSRQSVYPVIRFSPQLDNLIGIKELRSIKDLKTHAYSFAPSNPDGLAVSPGSYVLPSNPTGFDMRAIMTFEEDITTDMTGGSSAVLVNLLHQRAVKALDDHRFVKTLDGEIVPGFQYKYGRDYRLGDLIEVQGRSGVVQISRVTEYIRSHDDSGEKAYPTVALLE